MPLHCFIRSRIEPVFRVTRLDVEPMNVEMEVEYGANDKKKTTRELIRMQRTARLELEVVERKPL